MFKNKDRVLAVSPCLFSFKEFYETKSFFKGCYISFGIIGIAAVLLRRLGDAAKFFFAGLISLGHALNVSSLERIMLVSIDNTKTSLTHRYTIACSR